MKINYKNQHKWYRNSFSYLTGAVLLSMLQIITLLFTGQPWGVTSAFVNWGSWLYEALGGDTSNWEYFSRTTIRAYHEAGFLSDPVTLRNVGIILGAFFSALLASQFKAKKIKSKKQVLAAAAGGLAMGYGSSIARGCNIGAFYSGISSLSLSGWVFALFLFIGAIIGSKILIKHLL